MSFERYDEFDKSTVEDILDEYISKMYSVKDAFDRLPPTLTGEPYHALINSLKGIVNDFNNELDSIKQYIDKTL